ncbi:MAG: hypothetical protein K2Y56_02070 [Methylobacterium sp.]|uniref:hypothetical protein n=1 Tax=Methylobacterium sp. TaxID=409 RepID=UPI0025DB76FF|nr:hypothetical protein [Methylobacterium sp.]MBX9930318.1 hypothetical protein [Methylobacterium sp.]
MRLLTALGSLVLISSQAVCARPWSEHEKLVAPASMIVLRHAQVSHQLGATRTLLTKLGDLGFQCDASGARLHEITIRCSRPGSQGPIKVVYLGSFSSSANVVIEAIWIDGRPLSDNERLASLTSVFAAGDP